jgi:hypothetical protein
MNARFTGGLVAAALLGAGLLCPGAAAAADPTGYPYDLGFKPSKLIATDDAVYAVGIDDDYAAHVAVAGGASVEIGTDIYWIETALTPDGSALRVVTSGEEGYRYWDVDTDDLAVTADGQPESGVSVEALGTDAGGTFEVDDVSEEGLVLATSAGDLTLTESESSDSAAIGAVAARGTVGDRTWYVAGTEFGDETQTATLWSYGEDEDTAGDPVDLGLGGSPDANVEGLAVDPTGDAVYALSWRDNGDDPQTSGLTVIADGTQTYVPLRYSAQEIALSPDGETLYLAEGDSVFAVETDRLADIPGYVEDEDLPSAWAGESWIRSLAVDPSGSVYAGLEDSVVAFSAPGAPTDLVATPDAMSTTAFSASWDEGKYSWELEEGEDGLTQYAYTVRNGEDGFVTSGTTYDQVVYVDGLQPGTTYTVEVTASNGLFTSEPAVTQVATFGRYISAPSAVTVQGNLTVGSQLSLATTGSWEAGTSVSYEWYGSNGEMGGAIGDGPTLTLTADHLGMTVTGVATGTKDGAAGVTINAQALGTVANAPATTPPTTTPPVTSPPPAAATPGKLTAPKPKIAGQAKVGKTLAAKAGSWTSGTKLTYHWSANGKRIKGADDAKLKLTKALKGKKISVEVTGTKAGYTTVTTKSKQTGKVRR